MTLHTHSATSVQSLSDLAIHGCFWEEREKSVNMFRKCKSVLVLTSSVFKSGRCDASLLKQLSVKSLNLVSNEGCRNLGDGSLTMWSSNSNIAIGFCSGTDRFERIWSMALESGDGMGKIPRAISIKDNPKDQMSDFSEIGIPCKRSGYVPSDAISFMCELSANSHLPLCSSLCPHMSSSWNQSGDPKHRSRTLLFHHYCSLVYC